MHLYMYACLYVCFVCTDRCVLTPNAAEFDRLVAAAVAMLTNQAGAETLLADLRSSNPAVQLRALSQTLGGIAVLLLFFVSYIVYIIRIFQPLFFCSRERRGDCAA